MEKMKAVVDGVVCEIKEIKGLSGASAGGSGRCTVTVTRNGRDEEVEAPVWSHGGRKVIFTPCRDLSGSSKLKLIQGFSRWYGDTGSGEDEWGAEYSMVVRMVLSGFLPVGGTTWLDLEPVMKEMARLCTPVERFVVETPAGDIVAASVPDPDYPGVWVTYENYDGEPGVIVEYDGGHYDETVREYIKEGRVRMSCYSAEYPDDEPAAIFELGGWRKFDRLFRECFEEYIEAPSKKLPVTDVEGEGRVLVDIAYDSHGRDDFCGTQIELVPEGGAYSERLLEQAHEVWRELALRDFNVGIESVTGISLAREPAAEKGE